MIDAPTCNGTDHACPGSGTGCPIHRLREPSHGNAESAMGTKNTEFVIQLILDSRREKAPAVFYGHGARFVLSVTIETR